MLKPVRMTERKMFRTSEGVRGSDASESSAVELFLGSWSAESIGEEVIKGDGPCVVCDDGDK